jgi:hypothetical protein
VTVPDHYVISLYNNLLRSHILLVNIEFKVFSKQLLILAPGHPSVIRKIYRV